MALFLSEADVAALVSPEDAIAAVEDALRRRAEGVVADVPRYHVPLGDGALAVLSAVDGERELACVKSYVVADGRMTFVVVLFERGEVAAVIEAARLGELRTAAASAVAARHLARPGAESLGLIGCGAQATSHAASLRAALPGIERVVAYCRSEQRLAAFCEEVGAEAADGHREAAAQDVVVTATTSRDPVLRGEWLRPGALVCAVGANRREARELDNVVIRRAGFVCCDSLATAKLEAGDLIEPVTQGVLDWLEVHELQEVVIGEVAGRQTDDDIVLFKSNGIASWDLAVAALSVQRARALKAGREL